MKKLLLMFVLLIAASGISAQRITTDKIDKNGSRLIETSYTCMYRRSIGRSLDHAVEFALRKVNDKYVIMARIQNMQMLKFVEGNGLQVKCANDSVVFLKNDKAGWTVNLSPRAPGRPIYTFLAFYDLTDAQAELFKSNNLLSIKVVYASGSYDGDLVPTYQTLLPKMFDMIAKEELRKPRK